MKIKMLANNVLMIKENAMGCRLLGLILFLFSGFGFVSALFNTDNTEPWWHLLLAIILPTCGLAMMIFTNSVKIIFDKSENTVYYTTTNIFQTYKEQFDLSKVDKVILETHCEHYGDAKSYRYAIKMKDRQSIPLTFYYINSFYSKKAKKAKKAKKVNDFLRS